MMKYALNWCFTSLNQKIQGFQPCISSNFHRSQIWTTEKSVPARPKIGKIVFEYYQLIQIWTRLLCTNLGSFLHIFCLEKFVMGNNMKNRWFCNWPHKTVCSFIHWFWRNLTIFFSVSLSVHTNTPKFSKKSIDRFFHNIELCCKKHAFFDLFLRVKKSLFSKYFPNAIR